LRMLQEQDRPQYQGLFWDREGHGADGKLATDSIVRMIGGDRSGETIILPVEFLARGFTR
jgi:hypothetical protein